MAEVSLWLDYYDDVYSDFDSRHYLKRRISEDFLLELRNAVKNKKEPTQDIILFVPEQRREEQTEKLITTSLKEFFTEQLRLTTYKCRLKLNRGIILGLAGIAIMIFNAFISSRNLQSLPLTTMKVILEPGSWFLLWASLDFLLYDWTDLKKERDFFRELAAANIDFRSS